MFIGRQEELGALSKLYGEDRFHFVVIYGRRRVGKTTLLTEFSKGKETVFFAAQETTAAISLKNFTDTVRSTIGMPPFLTQFSSWQDAFSYVGSVAKERRILLVLDEFPYMAKADKSLKSVLQNAIDHELKDTRLFLVLCGSQVSFMEQDVLGYKSPLYGRRTAQMRVEPMGFFESRLFFPHYSAEQQVEAYAMLGGVPLYLSKFLDSRSIEENVKEAILNIHSYLFEEPKSLLKQELREPMNYNAIIGAIASGGSRLNDIITKSGIHPEQCSKYLATLQELLLVRRELPFGEKQSSRRGAYALADNFFSFWHAFVFPNISSLQMGLADEVLASRIRPFLPAFFGHGFEAICRQHLIRVSRSGRLGERIIEIGRWWGNNPVRREQAEFDICARGQDGSLYIGECKWRNENLDLHVLKELREKGGEVFPGERMVLVLYSKSGFSESVLEEAKSKGDVFLFTMKDFDD